MFHFKKFSITHQTEGLKVNTDGCLLGALASTNDPRNCLDIGTGTGVIALMLAQKFPSATISALELNTTAFLQARKNIDASIFKNLIELYNTDLFQYETKLPFDLIVCNPPYFSNHLKGQDANKNIALHNDHLPQFQLMKKVNEIISETGNFWVIYPPMQMAAFEKIAAHFSLFINTSLVIENKPGKHHRNIACFSKEKANHPTIETLVLTDTVGNRSNAFSEIMKDFYL